LELADCELSGQAFRVEIQPREPRNLLILAGQIGPDAAAQLRDDAAHLAATGRGVDMDWREAESVTAASLQVLIALGVSLDGQGQTLRVTCDHPGIRGLLELAGLSNRFTCAIPMQGPIQGKPAA